MTCEHFPPKPLILNNREKYFSRVSARLSCPGIQPRSGDICVSRGRQPTVSAKSGPEPRSGGTRSTQTRELGKHRKWAAKSNGQKRIRVISFRINLLRTISCQAIDSKRPWKGYLSHSARTRDCRDQLASANWQLATGNW